MASTGQTRSTFPYQVKRWRAYLGVTQRRFAELWGVSVSLVQKIEADDYSVSQLSFERLEALRALLNLPSATFYGLIATHPDPVPDEAEPKASREGVAVRRLEAGREPLILPRPLLKAPAAHLAAFAVSPTDFAPDRVRYRLRVGALVVIDTSGLLPPGELSVVRLRYEGRACRAFLLIGAERPFLRPFDPDSDAVLEPGASELEPLGNVVGYWVGTA